MKYTVVYTDGRFYAYNNKGEYASYYSYSQPYKRSWSSVELLHNALTLNPPMPGLYWVSYTEAMPPLRSVTTAASYKPAHGGYPQPTTVATSTQAERQVPLSSGLQLALDRAWAALNARLTHEVLRKLHSKPWDPNDPVTPDDQTKRKEAFRRLSQPLVWPVIPERDDGSNEEPSTISDSLIDELSSKSTKVVEDAKRTQKFWVDFYTTRAGEAKSIGDDVGEQACLRRAYAAECRHYMTFTPL